MLTTWSYCQLSKRQQERMAAILPGSETLRNHNHKVQTTSFVPVAAAVFVAQAVPAMLFGTGHQGLHLKEWQGHFNQSGRNKPLAGWKALETSLGARAVGVAGRPASHSHHACYAGLFYIAWPLRAICYDICISIHTWQPFCKARTSEQPSDESTGGGQPKMPPFICCCPAADRKPSRI